jgi:uncharacterized membrane protein AbrB (regulator of aidB expression)
LQKVLKIIRNTHKHPINQALHCIGAPFYALGLAMLIVHLGGIQTNLAAGGTMALAAVAMFVLGHKIEGNIRSMAPVLLFRFLCVVVSRRGVARYSLTKRVHLLRA